MATSRGAPAGHAGCDVPGMAKRTHLAVLLPSLAALLSLPPIATADEGQPVPPPATASSSPRPYQQLTGGWGETRAVLEQRGVSVGANVTFDFSRVHANGEATGLIGRALVDANTTLDLGPLLGFPGATVFLQYYGKFGGNASDYVGDIQGFSNIDAASFNGIGEAWLEVKFLHDAMRVKGGRIDANTEFAALHSSEEFLNSSMGYSPTIWGMPTYPNPGNGVLSGLTAGEHFDVSVGAFERIQSVDGQPPAAGLDGVGTGPHQVGDAGRTRRLVLGRRVAPHRRRRAVGRRRLPAEPPVHSRRSSRRSGASAARKWATRPAVTCTCSRSTAKPMPCSAR